MTTVAVARSPEGHNDLAGYYKPAGRRHFWLRRLHSLTGLFFGGFICFHLLVNAYGMSPVAYQQDVNKIHSLQPNLALIEISCIFLPLLIHALYGIYITKAGVKFNTTEYNYGGNVRYTLQRVTGIILLAFIAYHLATMHRWGLGLVYRITGWPALSAFPLFHTKDAYARTVRAIKTPYSPNPWFWGNVLVMAFYLLGIWSATFHFANGLWTSAIAWGLTVTERAQKNWGHVCLTVGIIVTIIGTIAWWAFTVNGNPNYQPPNMAATAPSAVVLLPPSSQRWRSAKTMHRPAPRLRGTGMIGLPPPTNTSGGGNIGGRIATH